MSIAVTPSGSLADDLGVARGTVVEAYTQLAAEGWLISVAGSGTRVGEYLDRDSASACQARVSQVSEEERNDVDDLDCFVDRGDDDEGDDQRTETQGVLEPGPVSPASRQEAEAAGLKDLATVDPGGERGDEEGLPLDDEGDEVGDEDPVVPVDGREEDSPLHSR